LPLCGLDVGAAPLHRSGGWHGGEGHGDERRYASRGGSAWGRAETFPFCATGLIDMHVRIHQAGKHGQIACVENGGGGGVVVVRLDRLD
jgi:hypothetical protein